jgi:hypothetical protein
MVCLDKDRGSLYNLLSKHGKNMGNSLGRKRFWVNGPGGSRYSGVSQRFQDLPNCDVGDETPERVMRLTSKKNQELEWWNINEHAPSIQPFHKGAYMDPGMVGGNDWIRFPQLSADEILEEIDRVWGYDHPPDTCRVIKTHFGQLHIDYIRKLFPLDEIILVQRDLELCYDWWLEGGGINTRYPDYSWYGSNEGYHYYNSIVWHAHDTYVKLKGLSWHPFNREWLLQFGLDDEPNPRKFGDVRVCRVPL